MKSISLQCFGGKWGGGAESLFCGCVGVCVLVFWTDSCARGQGFGGRGISWQMNEYYTELYC